MNFDKDELDKFSALAATWWDPDGHSKPLHDINPVRLNFICTQTTIQGKNILDIGCGGGILTESLAKQGATLTGIDLSLEVLEVARQHAKTENLNINYECISAEALANKDINHFDAITCMELLEHVPDPAALIKACANLVKPGGDIFFSTINRTPKAYLYTIIGAEYILGLLPKGTHDYAKFIRPSELESWSRSANLTFKAIKGMNYNLLSQTYKLTNDVSANYLVHCQK